MTEAATSRFIFIEGHFSDGQSSPLDAQALAFEPVEGGGMRLSIRKTLPNPLYLQHRCEGSTAVESQLQIHIAPHVQVTICETFLPMPAPTGGWKGATEITLEKGAQCEYLHFQQPVAGTWEHDISVYQEADSMWQGHSFLTGASTHHADFHVEQAGAHATASLLCAFLGKATQRIEISSTMVHAVAETHSHQLVKGIASEKSRCSFRGMVHVKPQAKNAVGKMHNHNLLLDPTAEAQSMPCFQIDHDQVICNHGATVGQLRDDEFFYLQARGIPRAKAELLLSRAFLEETVAVSAQRPEIGPSITAYIDSFFAGRARITKEETT